LKPTFRRTPNKLFNIRQKISFRIYDMGQKCKMISDIHHRWRRNICILEIGMEKYSKSGQNIQAQNDFR